MFDISSGENQVPWSLYFPVAKSYDGPKGKRIIEAPLSEPSEDLQGEEMVMAGLLKGLETWDRFKRPVDLDHLFERTRDPCYLIGKGIERYEAPHPHTGLDVPWMRAELFWDGKVGKPLAKSVVEHLENGGDLGISVAGLAAIRDPEKNSRIVQPIITSVAVTPVPVQAENSGTVHLVKSLSALSHGRIRDINAINDVKFLVPETRGIVLPFMSKAVEVMPGLPHTGPGASALAVEDLGSRLKRIRKKGALLQKAAGDLTIEELYGLIFAAQLAEVVK